MSDHHILLSDCLFIVHDTFTSLDLGLVGDLLESVLQVVAGIAVFGGSDDDPRCVGEEVVHLFERATSGLGQEQPEEDGVGEVADLFRCLLVEGILRRYHGDAEGLRGRRRLTIKTK
jgi:hypothetical protein